MPAVASKRGSAEIAELAAPPACGPFGAQAFEDPAAGRGDVEERGPVHSFTVPGFGPVHSFECERFGASEPLGLGGPTV